MSLALEETGAQSPRPEADMNRMPLGLALSLLSAVLAHLTRYCPGKGAQFDNVATCNVSEVDKNRHRT